MRILHVTPTYLPATRYGGPIRSVHGLCRALARRGHAVHVFTTRVDGPADSAVPVGAPVGLDGVRVWYFDSPTARRLYWSPGLGRAHGEPGDADDARVLAEQVEGFSRLLREADDALGVAASHRRTVAGAQLRAHGRCATLPR